MFWKVRRRCLKVSSACRQGRLTWTEAGRSQKNIPAVFRENYAGLTRHLEAAEPPERRSFTVLQSDLIKIPAAGI
jgi:hypothetical protein